MYKYDPFSDKFTKTSDDGPGSQGTSTATMTGAIPVYTYPCVYIADECIEKIADAVIRKMKGDANDAYMG